MKSLHLALRAVGFSRIAFVMSSATCDGLFKNADNITFTAVLEHEFTINEAASNPGGKDYATKPEDEVLDAAKVSKDFAEHADKIEKISINSITYVMSGYSSTCLNPVGFSNGTFTFSDPDQSGTGGVVKNVAHTNLQADQGKDFTLTFTQAEIDDLANLLKDKKKVRMHAAGHLSCTPLVLKVKATLNCTISARVL